MKNKKVLVVFSGGLDSAKLVYDNFLQNNNIIVLYINGTNNPEKHEMKKMQLIKIFQYFFR